MSEEAKIFASRVEKALGLPVEMMDERLSSWEAHEMLSAPNSNKRTSRSSSGRTGTGKTIFVDDVAAAVILRDYLQRQGAGSRD
jgi:putative transcription antitermination factor YqgF